jgi:Protein of unknown function (DUF2439)
MQSVVVTSAGTSYSFVESDDNRTDCVVNVARQDVQHQTATRHQPAQQFACLYTKHKTQKHKLWLDGRLVVSSSGIVTLYAADPAPGSGDPMLERLELTRSETDSLLRLQPTESENYLITIEGPWTKRTTDQQKPGAPLVSSGMQKVLSKKFQKPSHKLPPPPIQTNREPKRRRPMQPGELVQQYYGGATSATPPEPLHQVAVPSFVHPPPEVVLRDTFEVVADRNAPVYRTSAFVSNAFDANHFYGDEELEEEEADGAPEAFAFLDTEGPAEKAPEQLPTFGTIVPLPSTTSPRNALAEIAANDNFDHVKLSNTQLLDLFQFSNFRDEKEEEAEDAFVLPPANDEEDDLTDTSLASHENGNA